MKEVSLNGKWKVYSLDKKYNLEVLVPGTVFEYLEKNNEFGKEGIFYRDNNRRCVDIADRDFVYERKFTLPANFFGKNKKVFLQADGLDTITEIKINGKKIANTENMHIRYKFDVTNILKKGENKIEIIFYSSIRYINEKLKKSRIIDNDIIHSIPGTYHIRKSHCSYGWDWGPQVPDIGIWRNIKIVCYEDAKINEVYILQKHLKNKVLLDINLDINVWNNTKYFVEIEITEPSGKKLLHRNDNLSKVKINIENPLLWWPNGYGKQNLYSVDVRLVKKDTKKVIDVKKMRIGLRSIFIRRKKDRWGESFEFVVNNIPIFIKGADYIPEDICLARVKPERTYKLLKYAVEANFNLIRVWGGGVYPSDSFFDICDELGILVWQDMMFACMIYDMDDEKFVESIKKEIEDNLLRIRNHACLSLICGNNEIEEAFELWGRRYNKYHRKNF